MKKIISLLSLISILFISCEVEPGPEGPQGPPGADGILGQVFEVEVDFTAADNYETLVEFPSNIEVYESDIVMAYILDEVDMGTDIWEPLPQTLFIGGELLMYSYDHTYFDINFFIDGTIDPAGLDPIYRDGIVMRVAIIPADFAKNIDINDIDQVMGALQLKSATKIIN